MHKYENNAFVEEMDAIILLNDNYADQGLFKGYIGTVMANFIEKYGFVVADFSNPIESGYIQRNGLFFALKMRQKNILNNSN